MCQPEHSPILATSRRRSACGGAGPEPHTVRANVRAEFHSFPPTPNEVPRRINVRTMVQSASIKADIGCVAFFMGPARPVKFGRGSPGNTVVPGLVGMLMSK